VHGTDPQPTGQADTHASELPKGSTLTSSA